MIAVYKRLGNSFYFIHNREGFQAAMQEFFVEHKCIWSDCSDEVPKDTYTIPQAGHLPALVSFSIAFSEIGVVYFNFVPLCFVEEGLEEFNEERKNG